MRAFQVQVGDIVQLKWENINLETGALSFTTRKTDRRQILPLARPLVDWLNRSVILRYLVDPEKLETGNC